LEAPHGSPHVWRSASPVLGSKVGIWYLGHLETLC
jgi:hypothetical protein